MSSKVPKAHQRAAPPVATKATPTKAALPTRPELEQRLAQLEAARDQLAAQLNATIGGINVLRGLLAPPATPPADKK